MKKLLPPFYSFIFCLFVSTSIFGQNESYRIADMFTTDDGMSHNYVNCLEQFKIGILLIGTQNGLQIYDGYDFEIYNSDSTSQPRLNNNNITSITTSNKLNTWIASDNGINIINPLTLNSKSLFNIGNDEFPPIKSRVGTTTILSSNMKGDIWIVNNGILCQVINGEVVKYFPEKYADISKIVIDNQDNIFAFTKNFLIGISSKGELLFELDQFSSSKYGIQKRENLTNLFATKSGEVIAEDFQQKRFYKIRSTGETEDLTIENHWFPRLFNQIDEQISQYNINSIKKLDILESDNNLIWVATDFGLLKIEVIHNYFETIPELNGISCRELHEASNGIIYGGTFSPNHFFRYDPSNKEFKWIKNNSDATDMISLNSDSILVIGADGEVRIFSQKEQKVVSKINGINDTKLRSVIQDNDILWFGGVKGLYYSTVFDPLNISKVDIPKGDFVEENLVRDICLIGDSTMLLASNNGAALYHKTKGTQIVFDEDSSTGKKVLDNIIGQFVKDQKGNVWIATDGGLNYLDVGKMKITQAFQHSDGLPSNIIYSTVLSGDSVLWMGTANGLSQFDIRRKKFFNYFKKEGIADNEFNSNSFINSKSGKIYIGGIKGITIIDPKNSNFVKRPSSHFIVRYFKYNSNTGKINKFLINPLNIKPIYQKPYESFFELHFVNSDFTSPFRNTFSYKLEGHEEKWVPKTNENKVRFSNLEAGEYIFKLKSSNANGVDNNYIFEVPIIVEEYFYKSKWFLVLIGLLLFGLVVGFFQYRFYLYSQQIALRNKLARDLHDEMSNSFNNIRIIAKDSNPEDIEKTKEDMYHIANMSSEAIEMVEDVIWSLNRSNHTVGDMIMKLEDLLDDVLRVRNIPFTFEKIGIDEEGSLNYLYRRNLLLIFKEAITNTVKHSKPLHVYILFKDEPDTLHFQITNVFDELVKSKYSTGLGIPGMRQRAEFINATIQVKKAKHQFDIIMKMKKVKTKGFKKK